MTCFEDHIKKQIRQSGPLDVSSFMAQAVSYYYATRDPFGAEGDFTTAPEISQMFGEMLGAWVVDTWQKLGSPDPFVLLECGPGRGTLMADMLRVAKGVPGFLEAAHVMLMETSPRLREKQKEALALYDVRWVESFDDPYWRDVDAPIILVANELLDALPIRQAQYADGRWYERMIALQGDKFVFALGAETEGPGIAAPGDVYESAPVRDAFIRQVSALLQERTGAALFIDYGYEDSSGGETLQAVKAHKFVPVLEDVGEADVTAHVDFAAIARAASVPVCGPVGQGAFLERLGMAQRAQKLLDVASLPQQKPQQKEIKAAYDRLCAPNQMGTLFKVMTLCHDERIELAGF